MTSPAQRCAGPGPQRCSHSRALTGLSSSQDTKSLTLLVAPHPGPPTTHTHVPPALLRTGGANPLHVAPHPGPPTTHVPPALLRTGGANIAASPCSLGLELVRVQSAVDQAHAQHLPACPNHPPTNHPPISVNLRFFQGCQCPAQVSSNSPCTGHPLRWSYGTRVESWGATNFQQCSAHPLAESTP
jgi:hypothetical protein